MPVSIVKDFFEKMTNNSFFPQNDRFITIRSYSSTKIFEYLNFNFQSPWCYSGEDIGVIKPQNVGVEGTPCMTITNLEIITQKLTNVQAKLKSGEVVLFKIQLFKQFGSLNDNSFPKKGKNETFLEEGQFGHHLIHLDFELQRLVPFSDLKPSLLADCSAVAKQIFSCLDFFHFDQELLEPEKSVEFVVFLFTFFSIVNYIFPNRLNLLSFYLHFFNYKVYNINYIFSLLEIELCFLRFFRIIVKNCFKFSVGLFSSKTRFSNCWVNLLSLGRAVLYLWRNNRNLMTQCSSNLAKRPCVHYDEKIVLIRFQTRFSSRSNLDHQRSF